MRHVKVRNASKVEAEISARSYKKLCQHLKGYNKKQLWKIMDHYIFHVMEDHHVEELLKILDSFNKTNSLMDPHEVQPAVQASAPEEEVDAPLPERRMEFNDVITAEDLDSSKGRMDLMYDVNYFTYLTPEAAATNAKKLVEYAHENDMKAPAHWHLIAQAGADFLTLMDDESEGEDEEEGEGE